MSLNMKKGKFISIELMTTVIQLMVIVAVLMIIFTTSIGAAYLVYYATSAKIDPPASYQNYHNQKSVEQSYHDYHE